MGEIYLKKLEAVIFDYDGTLIDTEKAYYEVIKELIFNKYNKEIDKLDYIYNVSGTSAAQCKKYLTEKYIISDEEYTLLEKEMTTMMYEKLSKLQALPYIEETFEFLHQENIKIAIASNGNLEHIVDGLKFLGLYNYVTDIVTRYDVEHGKPEPDIYLHTADRLGVDIENCIAVEDSENGARAAVASGAYLIVQTNEITRNFNFDNINYRQKDVNLLEVIKEILKK